MKVELRAITKKCHLGNGDRDAILGKCKLLSERVTTHVASPWTAGERGRYRRNRRP